MSRGRFIWLPPMVGLLISGCATGGTAQTPPHSGGPSAGVGVSGGRSGVGVSSSVQIPPPPDPVLSSTLKGAAIGALGGPIGLGAGALAGFIYGLFERDRTEKQAQSEMTRQAKIDNELERQIETKREVVAQHGAGAGSGLILVEDHLAPAREVPSTTVATTPSASGESVVLVTDHLAPPATSTAAPTAPTKKPSPTVTAAGEEPGKPLESQQLDERLAAARERQRKLQEALRGTPPSTETTTVAASSGRESRAAVDPEGFRPIYVEGRLVRKERDVNGDGKPDILRYYDGTGRLTRQEEDSRLVGRLDTWTFYEDGRPVRKESDTNGDGKVDFWAFYDSSGDVVRTEADTDHDGHRDRVTLYAKGEMVEEQQYSPGLDVPRAVITYAAGKPARKEEDGDGDGRMDRLTEYDGSGRVTKVSRNPVKAGSYSVVAYYQPKTAEMLREEEDLNGDGSIDTISYYQQGRLVRREFFDLPEVAALTRQLSTPPMPQEAP